MGKTNKIIILLILLITILPGCIPRQKIVDEIELPQILSFDMDENTFTGTVLVPRYKALGVTEFKLIDAVSNSNYDIIPRINLKTKHQIENGQLGMVLFGSEYSASGIGDELQSLTRDPKIPARLHLGVADGKASELLKIIEKSGEPFFLSYMVEQNIRNGNLPKVNLHESLFNYYGEGRDMFLPYFKTERGEIRIEGLALFRNDKNITNISNKEAFIMKLLLDNSKNGNYMVPVIDEPTNETTDEYILIKIKNSKVYKTINTDEFPPSISIHLAMKIGVEDIPDPIELKSKNHFIKLEKKIGSHFENEIRKLISLCQENNVDPIGLGDLVINKSKDLNPKELNKIYPELKTSVSVQVNIMQTGTTE